MTLRNTPDSQPDKSFKYDLLGRLTKESRAGNDFTRDYGALSRLQSVKFGTLASDAITYDYDDAGQRKKIDYPGSIYVIYEHNDAGDLRYIRVNGNTALATYDYDDLGRRTSVTRANGVATTYDCHPASRLDGLTQNQAGSGVTAA